MCGLIHDFVRMVSRTEYATIDDLSSFKKTIDDLHCNMILPTIRHLSVITDSAHLEDPHNVKIEERIRNAVKAVKHLRTLVLIGQHNSLLFQSFKVIVQKEHHLRLLQISTAFADIDPFCNLVNPTHVRYIKLDNGALPQSLSKSYHLQVLDTGSKSYPIIPNGMDNLVSLRHLVVGKQTCSLIASISKMTSLQELHDFRIGSSTSLKIAQLQSMNQLVQLGVSQLENITSGAEACGAGLRDKQNLQRLQLSWSPCLSQVECNNAREVLEGLEPHKNLKHLQIFCYNGATSPSWLATSLTSLQTLHLEGCGQWQIIPSLARLPFLRKMELGSMQNVLEIQIPPLEELILFQMPKLERCSITSMRDLNSSLRVLKIEMCPVLKVFPLFENCQQFGIERTSWLSHLRELTIHYCPDLHVHNPLPPSSNVSKLSIRKVSTLPTVEGSSSGTLRIELKLYAIDIFYRDSYQLIMLDEKVLSFHNLRFLTGLEIFGCLNPMCISFEGLRHLICLKSLMIRNFSELLFSDVPLELSCEDMAGANRSALPSLECLNIIFCEITGKWLSLMLQHAQALKELSLIRCNQRRGISIGEEESSRPNLIVSAAEAPSSLNFAGFTSLEKLEIGRCPERLLSLVHNDGNGELANGRWLLPQSLVELELKIEDVDFLEGIPKNYSLETLEPCFPGNLTRMKKLEVSWIPELPSLNLHSCTALEELIIENCKSLGGLKSLGNLRLLRADRCLSGYVEDGKCLLPQSLEELYISKCSQETLQLCFPENLTSLRKLVVEGNQSLTHLQLHSCTALQELIIEDCESLNSLGGLKSLGNLRLLRAERCLSGHVEDGRCLLPQSLEELCISKCYQETLQLCFPENLTCLKRLEASETSSLKYLELQSCTALEELTIKLCKSLATIEGLQSLVSLRRLEVFGCPRLERFQIDQQERALQLPTSLQELRFLYCINLIDLPTELHSIPSLKRLEIQGCRSIVRLPEKGLPPSLEELYIRYCSEELAHQCRTLASNLKVKINGIYMK